MNDGTRYGKLIQLSMVSDTLEVIAMLFAIDHGNSAIKTPNFLFTSGVTDYPVKPPTEMDTLS